MCKAIYRGYTLTLFTTGSPRPTLAFYNILPIRQMMNIMSKQWESSSLTSWTLGTGYIFR